MSQELAKQTVATIEKALANKNQATAINEVIQIIQELASKAFSISVAELSQLISKDVAITKKVIDSANTFGFNPSGHEITTISQAIHTIGFERIRNLSISLLLVENAGKSLNSHEQKEMAAMAVTSGLMAQQMIDQMNSDIDPEFAYVCSSLRNYGKLLMTTFLVEDYREAKSIGDETKDHDAAFVEVFGLTPLKLGQILLQSSNLPQSIMNSLEEVSPSVLEEAIHTEDAKVCVLADFCVKVCETTFDSDVPPEDFNNSVNKLIDKYNKCLPITLDMVNLSLGEIDTSVSVFNRTIGLSNSDSPLSVGIKSRINGRPVPARKIIDPPPKSKTPDKEKAAKPPPDTKKQSEAVSENVYKNTMGLLLRKREPGETINFKEIYDSVVETTASSLNVESCMVFVEEEGKPGIFSARSGVGNVFKNVKHRPVISPKNRDIFSICILKKEDILIQDITAGKISSVIPDWITLNSKAKSIALFPLSHGKKLYALMVCISRTDQTIKLDKNDLRRIKSMRASLSLLRQQVDKGTLNSI
ncbi:HDOD domain-containing protein [Puniceicoccaceae bacterium K14]|nr:HDOD domain-containing protein [Puniceicoccaceae bacterium K14]